MQTAGIWMLVSVAVTLIVTGLPAWIVLIGVALIFSIVGVAMGIFEWQLLTAVPARLLGLLENDLLQALPLYVLMGSLLNHLPLARTLFRVGSRLFAPSGAGAPLAALGLGALLAPMSGSVGASVAMLSRTVQRPLEASGLPLERSAALVCVASTLGVVVPPSLVLILLGDAMMRSHTEATNLTREAVRIVNTQDIFTGALMPAALLLLLVAAVAWRSRSRPDKHADDHATSPTPTVAEWITAVVTTSFVVLLLGGVTLGYIYAVEAAAAGGVALCMFGVIKRTLTPAVLRAVLSDTMAISGALFALLVAATDFTLVLRAYGTDRWAASALAGLGGATGGGALALGIVLVVIALCALVLDAFEMIFVVIPVVMPPLLTVVHDATRVAVLTLLILQASFLTPPFGYSVLMVRASLRRPLAMRRLGRALLPYVIAQLFVLSLVLAMPSLVWQRNPTSLRSATPVGADADREGRQILEQQLNEQQPR